MCVGKKKKSCVQCCDVGSKDEDADLQKITVEYPSRTLIYKHTFYATQANEHDR